MDAAIKLGTQRADIGVMGQSSQVGTKVGLLICIALLTTVRCQGQKVSEVTTVRMDTDAAHKMVRVPCQINGGRYRYTCLIDSGATNTIISDRIVRADRKITEISTGGGVVRVGQREVVLTIADKLELKSKASIQSMMPEGIDILLGEDILRQFKFVIFDYENQQVEFQK